VPTLQEEVIQAQEASVATESARVAALASALLEGELAEVSQAGEATEENSRGLSDAAAEAEPWWEESKMECREQVDELTPLQI
jgi:hypothetical protein